MSNDLVVTQPSNAEIYRSSTDAAGLCGEIVRKTALVIQKRKYVRVEGWQAIAIAHGCTASAGDVEELENGVRAIGEIRRMSDGQMIARGEGFVGKDEPTWYGGESEVWDYEARRRVKRVLPRRPDYAIRAMAQTRAISRACRSAFAHVVVLIDENLSTTPAEEVPPGGFNDDVIEAKAEPAKPAREATSAKAPPVTKPVDRNGAAIPAPQSDDAKDWSRWVDVVASRFTKARTVQEIETLKAAVSTDVERCDVIIPGTLGNFADFIDGELERVKAA